MARRRFLPCTARELPEHERIAAASTAIDHNPANRPAGVTEPARLALLTTKYWGSGGVKLSVSFLGRVAADLQARILAHMNAWAQWANVQFTPVASGGQVRISLGRGGYYSYLGTDILHIPAGQQTMNLEGFSMSTPQSEWDRVVKHETGHTLGFPHEHLRAAIVQRLDVRKTIAYFQRTQGWSADQVRQQVLTPISEASLLSPTPADVDSIMAYQLPGSITVDGQPVPGGTDIDRIDQGYAAKVYPRPDAPPPPPPPPPPGPAGKVRVTLDVDAAAKTAAVVSVGGAP